jgi:hypothetical protein
MAHVLGEHYTPPAIGRRARAGDGGAGSRRRPATPGARSGLAGAVLLVATTLLPGCITLPRNGLPEALVAEAVIPGMPDGLRAPGLKLDPHFMADLEQSFADESEDDFAVDADGTVHYPHLALSGGGANGAFGAGLLSGWSNTGKRPTFKIVTGVSTGALMAPFVFLGPEHDVTLQMFYTTTSSSGIFRRLPILRQLVSGESLADAAPLGSMIEQVVDRALLEQVAQAHRQGRRLYVGTADIDAQRFMVWNMGLLAASGRPGALELFRKIMLASASIPIAFQPVLFEVEARGERYDELHVDGAVGTNVFYSGGVFDFADARVRAGKTAAREDIYIIHNGQLAPTHATTSRTLGSIALRSLAAAGKASAIGDLFRIYAVARRNEAGFYWVTIPAGISLEGEEVFDPALMRKLFDLGFDMSQKDSYWNSSPPGFARPGEGPR